MEKTYLILIYMSRFVLIKSFCRRRYLLAVWGIHGVFGGEEWKELFLTEKKGMVICAYVY